MSAVIESYTKEISFEGTPKECLKFIYDSAKELNYGIFRRWTVDGNTYYDVGPVTYIFNDEQLTQETL